MLLNFEVVCYTREFRGAELPPLSLIPDAQNRVWKVLGKITLVMQVELLMFAVLFPLTLS